MSRPDVVIIDDDPGVCWALKETLGCYNISNEAVNSASEGIELAVREKPPLMIIDLKLGAMDGVEVAEKVNALHKEIKIIFLSGYADTIRETIAQELPVLGVFNKPFNIQILLETILEGLGRNSVSAIKAETENNFK